MHKLLLYTLFIFCVHNSLSQALIKEEDYRDNDPGKSQIVKCNSDPIFRIEVDKAFETNVFSTMTLTKLKSYIIGYDITDLPKEMTAKAGTSFSVYTWRPGTTDIFPENFKGKTITVIPKIDPALVPEGESLSCKSFDIELPFKRDRRPTLAFKSERTIRIELDGSQVDKQYDLLGRFPSIDFKIFEDDFDRVLTITLTKAGTGFKMDNIEDGVLKFSYKGAVPDNNIYKLEVEAKDSKGQSTKANINVELVKKDKDIAPVFSSIFNGDREFKHGKVLKEGSLKNGQTIHEVTLPFKEFGGYNPANNKKFKFTPKKVSLSQWDFDIDQQSLYWLPDYNTIDDVWDEKPQEVKIPFVISNDPSIKNDLREVTFIAQVINQTEPENLKLYTEAKASYKSSNEKAFNVIKKSLCYLTKAAAIISRKNGNIDAIESSLAGIGEIATIAASTNPWVVGLKSAAGVIVSNIKETNKVKTEQVKNLFLAFNDELQAIEKKQTELYTLEQSIGNFITKKEAMQYSKLSDEYSKLIRAFAIKDSKYTSVTTAFKNKKDKTDIASCG